MRDDPSGGALLDIAHQTLMDELVPTLKGRDRFLALMIGNAVRIVGRELASAEQHRAMAARVEAAAASHVGTQDRPPGLVAAIRGGRLDGDASLHAALQQLAIVAVGISKPGFLSSAERQALAAADALAMSAPAPSR